ncbi:MAG: hypothetical protein BWK72_19275 [Rhodoferax ferrireducens]|uniref:HTH cro/C1-type domain-containing protein n=1 Tax=Rhodoferax ferrireducens TaxID=192843 RepID=A0A1W9KPL7_9BURK|nr:MAG: hypothetical protein BWK72_19275 [Rhodoferax ferrireducens]
MLHEVSQLNNTVPEGFGLRLKAERQRLKLNQAEFAALGGVSRPSQVYYESEQRVPDVRYLAALCEKVDVMYILSGKRHTEANTKAIDASVIQAILTTIDAWENTSVRLITDRFRAELVSLFLQQVDANGKVDTDLIKSTLRILDTQSATSIC